MTPPSPAPRRFVSLLLAALACFFVVPWLGRAALRSYEPELAQAAQLSRGGYATRSRTASIDPRGRDPWGRDYAFDSYNYGGGTAGAFSGAAGGKRANSGVAVALTNDDRRTYRSLGPDGVDQQGAGDDILLDSLFIERHALGTWGRAGVLGATFDGLWFLGLILGWAWLHAGAAPRETRIQAAYVGFVSLLPTCFVGAMLALYLSPRGFSPLGGVMRELESKALSSFLFFLGSYPLFFGVGLLARLWLNEPGEVTEGAERPPAAADPSEPPPSA